MFERVCRENDIEHRLTKHNHPWTNGQVERMNRTLKDATVKRYHYDSHDQLRTHLKLFLDAYNHARRLKHFRAVATRYEKHAANYLALVKLAATRIWMRAYESVS